jgi:uncharacterized protein
LARHPPLSVVVSGASGLIGSALVTALRAEGNRVTCLVRRKAAAGEIQWDPERERLLPHQLEEQDAVIHLAGENIGSRWTRSRKLRIRDSRVRGTRLLSETLAHLQRPPRVLVSASAVGIYGDRGDEVLTERSELGDPGREFLVSVCLEWEAAAAPARAAGIRVVHPRFGVVLSPDGGALRKLLPPFRLGLGGPISSGSQWMSWIALPDVVAAIQHLLTAEGLAGPVNLTAAQPVTNADFTRALARVLGRPAVIRVPAAGLRLALGEMARATILSSARVAPEKLLGSGYRFQHSSVEDALRSLLQEQTGSSFTR